MIIYKIVNLINGKIYIGQTTTSIKKRISCYYSEYKSNRTKQRVISAMKKYGFENFKFTIIDDAVDKNDLNAKEMYWIKEFDSTNPLVGYNVSLGGDNLWLNEDIRKKIIKANTGKKHSKEWKEKISNSLKGHKHSKETKDKLSNSQKERFKKESAWNKGTKGIMKQNSGSFKKGQVSPNKGKKRIKIGDKIKVI